MQLPFDVVKAVRREGVEALIPWFAMHSLDELRALVSRLPRDLQCVTDCRNYYCPSDSPAVAAAGADEELRERPEELRGVLRRCRATALPYWAQAVVTSGRFRQTACLALQGPHGNQTWPDCATLLEPLLQLAGTALCAAVGRTAPLQVYQVRGRQYAVTELPLLPTRAFHTKAFCVIPVLIRYVVQSWFGTTMSQHKHPLLPFCSTPCWTLSL